MTTTTATPAIDWNPENELWLERLRLAKAAISSAIWDNDDPVQRGVAERAARTVLAQVKADYRDFIERVKASVRTQQ